jgi:uncharacterized protein
VPHSNGWLLLEKSGRYIYYTFVLFEFDPNKSLENKAKHGLDFEEAQAIWHDPYAIRLPSRHQTGELRWVVLGMFQEKVWAAVMTCRRDTIRIISVRRAREEEVAFYEKRKLN